MARYSEKCPYKSIRKLPPGATDAVPYSEAKAVVWYLPFLDTEYDVTRMTMTGTVEIGFATLASARRFFDKAKKSGQIESAHLRVAEDGHGYGRIIDEY